MEFTEAESNMNDLVSEYQQYQARPFIPHENAPTTVNVGRDMLTNDTMPCTDVDGLCTNLSGCHCRGGRRASK